MTTTRKAEMRILRLSRSPIAILISTPLLLYSIAFKIFLILASHFSLWGAPWERDRDELGRVKILAKVLEEINTYRFFLLEDFESETPWGIYRGDSFLNETSFVAKTPKGEAWDREGEILAFLRQKSSGNYSFSVHSYVEIPGKEKIEIRPKEPIYIPLGIPIRLFYWAYAENLPMSLTLILSQEKSKDLHIPIGNLQFEGWRRVEIPLSIPPRNIRLIQSLQIPLRIRGIRVQSSPKQNKGGYFFYLDRISILLDTSSTLYPGSEVLDNWGK